MFEKTLVFTGVNVRKNQGHKIHSVFILLFQMGRTQWANTSLFSLFSSINATGPFKIKYKIKGLYFIPSAQNIFLPQYRVNNHTLKTNSLSFTPLCIPIQ